MTEFIIYTFIAIFAYQIGKIVGETLTQRYYANQQKEAANEHV
jgi:hypothetical protein